MMKKRRSISALFGVLLILFMMIQVLPAKATQKTIKVGWPTQAGLSLRDETGNYSGYTYDYLMEVAQYTGWQYEFVEVEGDINMQLSTLLSMLEKGEIDLLGAMRYNEAMAQMYEYPSESYGSFYNVLAILNDNDTIDEFNLAKQKNLRISVMSGSETMLKRLMQYTEMNNLSYELIESETAKEALMKVRNGEADALLTTDVGMESDMHMVAKFGSSPFYLASTKGNRALVTDLNQAILKIQDAYPTLESELYERYFVKTGNFVITSDERNFIQELGTIRVLYMDGFAPLSYTNDTEPRGAAVELLEKITEMTGISIAYVRAENVEEYQQLLEQGAFDIVLTHPYQLANAQEQEITMTSPYLEIPLTLVTRNQVDISSLSGKREAVIRGFSLRSQQNELIYEVDSMQAALQALEDGKADYFYGLGPMISYNSNQNRYHRIQILYGVQEEYGKICFGIKGSENAPLTVIFNKAIQTLPDKEIENYLYMHTYVPTSMSLQDYFYQHPMETFFLIIAVAGVIILFVYSHYTSQLKMKKQIEIENQRYRMLADVSGESVFEYDYKNDFLRVIGKGFETFDGILEYEHFTNVLKQRIENGIKEDENFLSLIKEPKEYCEMLLQKLDQTMHWHRIITRMLYDEYKEPLMMIGQIKDIHEEKLERDRLKQDAQMDKLTNMFNADSIRKLAEEAIPHAVSGHSALLIADMDNFKEINDRFGHYQGDRVLAQTGAALNAVFASSGLVGRLGGDEFLIYSDHIVDASVVETMCNTLANKMEQLEIGKKLDHAIKLSVGYVMVEEERDFYTLYKQADKALYQVKELGKNGICAYHEITKKNS